MKITEQENILIKKYFTHTLGDGDKEVFNNKLQSSYFRKELLYQAKLIDALEAVEEDLIRDELKTIDKFSAIEEGLVRDELKTIDNFSTIEEGLIRDELKEIDSQSKSSNLKSDNTNNSKLLKPVALLVFILLVSAVTFYIWNKGNTNEISYQQYAESYRTPFPAKEYDRGESTNDNQVKYDEAMKLYAEAKYKSALSQFKSLGDNSPENQLYIANCYIGIKAYKPAKIILSQLKVDNNKPLGYNRDWYLLICELGLDNKKEVLKIINKIENNQEHLFFNRARDLNEVINN